MPTDTNANNMNSGIHLGSNNARRIFDLRSTAGTAAINTQLKASKANIKRSPERDCC